MKFGLLAALGTVPVPLLGGTQSGTTSTVSISGSTVYHTTAVERRADTYSTRITGLDVRGATVYDQTFNLPYLDPVVQAAVADAGRAAVAASAPAAVRVEGPARLSHAEELVVRDSDTVETGRSTRDVVGNVAATAGPDVICAGDGEPQRGVPPTCDPQQPPHVVVAGTENIDVHVDRLTDVFQTLTTTDTFRTSEHYQVAAAPVAVPALSVWGLGALALLLAGAALLRLRGGAARRLLLVPLGLAAAARLQGETLTLASRVMPGFAGDTPGGRSVPLDASADGRYVLFASDAVDLVPGQVDRNGLADLFLWDRTTGAITLVTHVSGSPVTAANAGVSSSLLLEIPTAAISADGRFVAYTSAATDLVAGYVAGAGCGDVHEDVYLYDRVTGTTLLVSRRAGTLATGGNGCSGQPAVSADGRFVAYVSHAGDLVAGESGTASGGNVFLFDRDNPGAAALVTHQPGSPTAVADGITQETPAISGDGAYVAYYSSASNLVPGQVGHGGTFLYERATGTNVLASRKAGTTNVISDSNSVPTSAVALSSDGRWLAYSSALPDLVPGQIDTNDVTDLFLFDRVTGDNVLVDHVAGSAVTASATTFTEHVVGRVAISADGSWVAYRSDAPDLVAGQVPVATGGTALFLWERATGTNQLVTRRAGDSTAARPASSSPALSADGRYVAFASSAADLVAGQEPSNGTNAFLFDRTTGAAVLLSHRPGDPLAATGGIWDPGIVLAGGGTAAAFSNSAADLVAGVSDLNNFPDAFLYDVASGSNELVSRRDAGAVPATAPEGDTLGYHDPLASLSADGRYLAYASASAHGVAGQDDTNGALDVFLFDRVSLTTILVSRRAGTTATAGNGASDRPVVSADGRYVAFRSSATDLVAGQVDANQGGDVFLFDRLTGAMALVSHYHGAPARAGNRISDRPVMSGDGRYVAYESQSTDLAPLQQDANDQPDVFLYDRTTEESVLVSHAAAGNAVAGNGASGAPTLSGDGRWVAFSSLATDLTAAADANGAADVFLYDRESGGVTLVSHAAGNPLAAAGGASQRPALSGDGALLTFASTATDLVSGQVDVNGAADVFLYDRAADSTVLVSHQAGQPATAARNLAAPSLGDVSDGARISADGRFVAYVSKASNLVASQAENAASPQDVFLYDRTTGANTLVSHSSTSPAAAAGGLSFDPALSADGRYVAFTSVAGDLVAGQTAVPGFENIGFSNIFLFDRTTGGVSLVSHQAGAPAMAADGVSFYPLLSADGSCVAFSSFADDLDPLVQDANGYRDLYVLSRP